jgi:uncharacterized membrane protein
VLGVTLPEWLDVDNMRTVALVLILAALVLAFLVVRFVQKMVIKIMATVLLVAIAALAWYQRADLGDCAKTCDCKVLGFTVETPRSDDPGCTNAA